MYDVDDAVAKIDGYIISIAGAAPHVGEKRMVRIDQVGRTAASALLLDEAGEVVVAARPRRRRASASGVARRAGDGAAPASAPARARAGAARQADSEDAEVAPRKPGCSESATAIDSEPEEEPGARRRRAGRPRRAASSPPTSERTAARSGEGDGARMTYNPSLGAVAAEADGAVRLPRPGAPSSAEHAPGQR